MKITKKLRSIVSKVGTGPWSAEECPIKDGAGVTQETHWKIFEVWEDDPAFAEISNFGCKYQAEFIVASKTYMPALISRVDELENEVQKLREEVLALDPDQRNGCFLHREAPRPRCLLCKRAKETVEKDKAEAKRKEKFVCKRCDDTHRMPHLLDNGDTLVFMCTGCPTPCKECGGNGAYCYKTPCPCECHKHQEWSSYAEIE